MKKTWTLYEKIMNVYKGECALYHHQSGKHTAACTKKWREYPLQFLCKQKMLCQKRFLENCRNMRITNFICSEYSFINAAKNANH